MKATTSVEALMSVPEFGQRILKCSRSKSWKLARSGAFPIIQHGRIVRVNPTEALAAFQKKFESHEAKKTKAT
jgi:hypothetical protein